MIVLLALIAVVAAQALIEGKAAPEFNEQTGYLIQGKVDNRNLSALSFTNLELSITGQNGFRRNAFTNAHGKFSFHLVKPGSYKLEVLNKKFFFEPVRIKIETDAALAEIATKKQISASLFRLRETRPTKLMYPL